MEGESVIFLFISTADTTPDDREYMEALYCKYERLMYATACNYTKDPHEQEDIIQSSIEKLIKKISVIRPMKSCILAAYIVSTIRNTSINWLKKKASEQKYLQEMDPDQFDTPDISAPTMDELLLVSERRELIYRAWKSLPLDDCIVLEGKYILGYTDEELARQLKCKPENIRMRLCRARRKVFRIICDLEEMKI